MTAGGLLAPMVALSVAISLPGCSSDGQDQPLVPATTLAVSPTASSGQLACSLLTPAEVGTAVGSSVTSQSTGAVTSGSSDCEWVRTGAPPDSYSLRLVASSDPAAYDDLRPAGARTEPGLGTGAYLGQTEGDPVLGVRTATGSLLLTGPAADGVTPGMLRALARLALPRLRA